MVGSNIFITAHSVIRFIIKVSLIASFIWIGTASALPSNITNSSEPSIMFSGDDMVISMNPSHTLPINRIIIIDTKGNRTYALSSEEGHGDDDAGDHVDEHAHHDHDYGLLTPALIWALEGVHIAMIHVNTIKNSNFKALFASAATGVAAATVVNAAIFLASKKLPEGLISFLDLLGHGVIAYVSADAIQSIARHYWKLGASTSHALLQSYPTSQPTNNARYLSIIIVGTAAHFAKAAAVAGAVITGSHKEIGFALPLIPIVLPVLPLIIGHMKPEVFNNKASLLVSTGLLLSLGTLAGISAFMGELSERYDFNDEIYAVNQEEEDGIQKQLLHTFGLKRITGFSITASATFVMYCIYSFMTVKKLKRTINVPLEQQL